MKIFFGWGGGFLGLILGAVILGAVILRTAIRFLGFPRDFEILRLLGFFMLSDIDIFVFFGIFSNY